VKQILIRGEKPKYTIVIPTIPAPVEETAAQELQNYLKKALGTELPVCKEEAFAGKAFYIGHTQYAKTAGVFGKSEENWIIQLHEDNVILTGGVRENDRGILYAVYHFLEDVVGIRWWSVWEEYVPELTELSLEENFCREGTPFFEHRKVLGFRHMEDFYYDARTRGNVVGDDGLEGGVYHPCIKKLGGAKPFGRPHHVHTIDKYFPPEEYFAQHPEWFALYSGVRVPWSHFCLSSESLAEALTERLLAYIEEDKALSAKTGAALPDFYDISFPDQMEGFCQCDACRKAVEVSGVSGLALKFVNKIARVVAEKHPDVTLETPAYAVYIEPPKDDTVPEKNVMIRLANVYVDMIHKTREKGNLQHYRLLKAWSEICKQSGSKFQVWEYMFNIMVDMPLPVVRRLGDVFRTYADYVVSGMFVENERPSTDMWDLLQYVLVHLCEDPYADTDWLIDDFITKYYGPAAEYIAAYLKELFRCAEEHQNVSAICNVESAQFSFLDYKAVKKGMSLLDKAAQAVAEDPVLGPRVRYVQTLLGSALLVKYFDLKKTAEAAGETFAYDREAVRQMVVAGFREAQKHPRVSEKAPAEKLAEQIKFYSGMVFTQEPDTAPLPPALAHVAPEDVYQFFYKNSCRYFVYADLYGASFVEDPESALGHVLKLCRQEASHPSEVANLIATSRKAEHPRSIKFRVMKDWEYVDSVDLFLEDIVPDKYHLYQIGTVSGIREAGHVRIDLFGNNYEWLHLSGLAQVFPMDGCDVYLWAKFAGEPYGGSKTVREAVYLDRAIIVRKNKNM